MQSKLLEACDLLLDGRVHLTLSCSDFKEKLRVVNCVWLSNTKWATNKWKSCRAAVGEGVSPADDAGTFNEEGQEGQEEEGGGGDGASQCRTAIDSREEKLLGLLGTLVCLAFQPRLTPFQR